MSLFADDLLVYIQFYIEYKTIQYIPNQYHSTLFNTQIELFLLFGNNRDDNYDMDRLYNNYNVPDDLWNNHLYV